VLNRFLGFAVKSLKIAKCVLLSHLISLRVLHVSLAEFQTQFVDSRLMLGIRIIRN
jgi:hypothetical protein